MLALLFGVRVWTNETVESLQERSPQGGQQDSRPERVVLADASVVDLVTALVTKDRVAGLCSQAFQWSHFAMDPQAAEAWRGVPTFDTYITEVVLGYDPDLVVCHSTNNPETTATLRELGIPLLQLEHPTDLGAVRRLLTRLGARLGVPENGQRALADLDRALARSGLGRNARQRWSGMYFGPDGAGGGWSAGKGTLAHSVLDHVGLRNGMAGGSGHQRIATEQLIALAPDVLVISAEGGTPEGPVTELPEWARGDAMAVVPAVQHRRIVALHPARYSCGSQHLARAAQQIADAVDGWLGGR